MSALNDPTVHLDVTDDAETIPMTDSDTPSEPNPTEPAPTEHLSQPPDDDVAGPPTEVANIPTQLTYNHVHSFVTANGLPITIVYPPIMLIPSTPAQQAFEQELMNAYGHFCDQHLAHYAAHDRVDTHEVDQVPEVLAGYVALGEHLKKKQELHEEAVAKLAAYKASLASQAEAQQAVMEGMEDGGDEEEEQDEQDESELQFTAQAHQVAGDPVWAEVDCIQEPQDFWEQEEAVDEVEFEDSSEDV